MSVKLFSFTVPPAAPGRGGQWSCVTPNGLVTAEPGTIVSIIVSETWEQGLDAVKVVRETGEIEFPNREDKPSGGSHG